MSSENQVAQSVESIEKVVAANVEIDEYTTVDNDIQLEIPLAKVIFLKNPTYKVIGIGHTEPVLNLKTCPVDTGAGLSLINEDYLKPKPKCCIKPLESH